jgi:plasmid stability protein
MAARSRSLQFSESWFPTALQAGAMRGLPCIFVSVFDDASGPPGGIRRDVFVRVEAAVVRHGWIDMRATCEHAYSMSKMVQIRNVPDALHRKLKARAADSGQTLSGYLLAELERVAARPTRDEMLARIHSRKRVTLKTPAAVAIREERESA